MDIFAAIAGLPIQNKGRLTAGPLAFWLFGLARIGRVRRPRPTATDFRATPPENG
jgi:hypothetical protein